jgi:pimeloyl-ACP methyl ester carboxylesterase
MEQQAQYKIEFLSEIDQTMQPACFYKAEGDDPRPLVVALHTWSFGWDSCWNDYLLRCQRRNWHLIYPHFRGPNWTPEALGSDLVVSDLKSCVDYVKSVCKVDMDRIYLVGGSGGGHASLLLAARASAIWTAVSSWCPISDVGKWHQQCFEKQRHYWKHIEDACGGNPATDAKAAAEAAYRSPVTYLADAKNKTIIDIGTGIHDGHTGSVPICQAFEAFNLLAEEADRFSPDEINHMVETETVPAHLQFQGDDPAYGPYKVLLRRISGNTRITIFEGSHDIIYGPSFGFFDQQVRGQAPVWNSGDVYDSGNNALTK